MASATPFGVFPGLTFRPLQFVVRDFEVGVFSVLHSVPPPHNSFRFLFIPFTAMYVYTYYMYKHLLFNRIWI